jgi:hypothetical protein
MYTVDKRLIDIIDQARKNGILAFAKMQNGNFCNNLYYRDSNGVEVSVAKNIKTSSIPQDIFTSLHI